MTTTRFHQAAKDGLLDILKEATRKDCNLKDEDGMTPTLWAAHEGNLEALRLLVGRGGDPEKANYHFGQNALHLAASRGHLNCVTFLVAFNVNPWAVDHDFHTAMELAAMNGRQEILNYLDTTTAKLECNNRRKCEMLREKAEKDAERRMKKFEERSKKERDKQKKQFKKYERECGSTIDTYDCTLNGTYVRKTSQLMNGQTFTEIVGNGGGSLKKQSSSSSSTGIKKILDRRLKANTQGKHTSNGFNAMLIRDDSNVAKSVRSLYDQSGNKNAILHENGTTCGGKRGRIKDLFDIKRTLRRSTSQPDLIHQLPKDEIDRQVNRDLSIHLGDAGSLFDRPGFGSVAFRVPATLTTFSRVTSPYSDTETHSQKEEACSIGSAGSLVKRILPSQTKAWDTNSSSIHSSDEENSVITRQLSPPLHRFLLAVGVAEYEPEFTKQKIDMEALFMLSDDDLITLGIPLGPRRKLLNAIREYEKQSERCKEIFDARGKS